MSWFNHRPRISAARRKANAQKKTAALERKGQTLQPVQATTPRGRIATSFWGQAWCDHLESFSDFENRLPRGRTYLRNGSVLHLDIQPGRIESLVIGSNLYRQTIRIDPLPDARWQVLKQRCAGQIGSLIELLQGRISHEIMEIVTDRKAGLFPSPREIHLECSCPDWASLCKHLAAVLYGVGARLDTSPELLFRLRGVDHNELIQSDVGALTGAGARNSRRRTLAASALGDVFGIELDDESPGAETPTSGPATGIQPATLNPAAPDSRPAIPAAVPKATPAMTATSVHALRERLGLNRAEFAALLGVSSQTIANWENSIGPLKLHHRSRTRLSELLQSHPPEVGNTRRKRRNT